jgi:hypothetical protein
MTPTVKSGIATANVAMTDWESFNVRLGHLRRFGDVRDTSGATRYDKLAAHYLAFVQLASIRLWLRVNEPCPGTLSLMREYGRG